jgi:hypothetical protein
MAYSRYITAISQERHSNTNLKCTGPSIISFTSWVQGSPSSNSRLRIVTTAFSGRLDTVPLTVSIHALRTKQNARIMGDHVNPCVQFIISETTQRIYIKFCIVRQPP